jgi:hypothetical protein
MMNAERESEATARKTLRDLEHTENVFTGSLGPTLNRIRTHFSGQGDNSGDAMELWGKRIGRSLSLIGVVVLAIYLYVSYFR